MRMERLKHFLPKFLDMLATLCKQLDLCRDPHHMLKVLSLHMHQGMLAIERDGWSG